MKNKCQSNTKKLKTNGIINKINESTKKEQVYSFLNRFADDEKSSGIEGKWNVDHELWEKETGREWLNFSPTDIVVHQVSDNLYKVVFYDNIVMHFENETYFWDGKFLSGSVYMYELLTTFIGVIQHHTEKKDEPSVVFKEDEDDCFQFYLTADSINDIAVKLVEIYSSLPGDISNGVDEAVSKYLKLKN